MKWLFRRLFGPFAVGSLVCILLLLAWTKVAAGTRVAIGFPETALASLFILPFEAIGLALLLPIGLGLRNMLLPRRVKWLLLVIIGAMLGIVVVLPIIDFNNMPALLELALPAACGALSAGVWFAFNRDLARR